MTDKCRLKLFGYRFIGILVMVISAFAYVYIAHIIDVGYYNLCDPFSLCSENSECVWLMVGAMVTEAFFFCGISLVLLGSGKKRSIDGRFPWWSLVAAIDLTTTGVSLVLIHFMRIFCLEESNVSFWPAAIFYSFMVAVLFARVVLLVAAIMRGLRKKQARLRGKLITSVYLLWSIGMAVWLIAAVL